SEYVAQRDATGWSVHGITPPQDPTAYAATLENETGIVGEVSDDLSTGVMYALKPLTEGAPNVVKVPNLDLRRDFPSGQTWSYVLLSGYVNQYPFYLQTQPSIVFDGASEDISPIIFVSQSDVTEAATGGEFKLHEREGGTVRLVGVLPGGEPAAGSVAGLGT